MVKEFLHKNYWAIILGGSSGLGLASAKKLAAHGMNVCIIHRDRKADLPRINEDFDTIKNLGVKCLHFNIDALNPEKRTQVINEVRENFDAESKVRVLIHSIAKGNLKPMIADKGPTLQHDDFVLTLQSMAISLYDWTKTLYEAELFGKQTRIISFTSEGNTKAWENYAAVSAAKVALEAITRSIALEFAGAGIKANCIQAGVTDTASMRMIPGSEALKEHAVMRNPHSRLTRPEDVANVVYLLSKDEAAWINGCTIPVDGGEHLR